jgi:hypothetical protein
MKKYLLLLLATALIFSCKKYEEGPNLSLRSKKARLCQRWIITEQKVNGNNINITSLFASFDFEKNNNFSSYVLADGKQYEGEGTWEFNNNKDNLYLTYNTGGYNKLEIQRLTKKDFWFNYNYTNSEGVNSIIEEKYEPQK